MIHYYQILGIEQVVLTIPLVKSGDHGRTTRLSLVSPTRRLLSDPPLLLLLLSELLSSAASFLISRERRSLKRLEEHPLTPRELLKRLGDPLSP
tara:strand:+ start:771 stop:1052 length:282 start_codon:yes stop_codon:yes gene_type:complete